MPTPIPTVPVDVMSTPTDWSAALIGVVGALVAALIGAGAGLMGAYFGAKRAAESANRLAAQTQRWAINADTAEKIVEYIYELRRFAAALDAFCNEVARGITDTSLSPGKIGQALDFGPFVHGSSNLKPFREEGERAYLAAQRYRVYIDARRVGPLREPLRDVARLSKVAMEEGFNRVGKKDEADGRRPTELVAALKMLSDSLAEWLEAALPNPLG